jgi:hypothetical protein
MRSYQLHANCYITKPVDFEEFSEIIRALLEFWLTVAKLPARTAAVVGDAAQV